MLSCKKIKYDDEHYYVIMYNKKKLNLGNLGLLLNKITIKTLLNIKEHKGEINNIKGENIITFKTEEHVQEYLNHLNSEIVLNKLLQKNAN